MRKLQYFLILITGLYLLSATINTVTTYESIDEYSLDYWSNRVADRFWEPQKALKLDPGWDRYFGFTGFIRGSGHFVYNRTLDEIAEGKEYKIIPMVHLVPIYIYGAIKVLAGKYSFYFIHLFLLLGGMGLVFLYSARQREDVNPSALLAVLLATPALLANATHVMTDSVGFFGISLFSYAFFSQQWRHSWKECFLMGCLVLATVLCVFYKPIGWLTFPWCIFLLLMGKGMCIRKRLAVTVLVLALVAGIAFLSCSIYSSPLWAGYLRPINHFLKKNPTVDIRTLMGKGISEEDAKLLIKAMQDETFARTAKARYLLTRYGKVFQESIRDAEAKEAQREGVFKVESTVGQNIVYGIPSLFLGFPMLGILIAAILRDLHMAFGRVRQAGFGEEWREFLIKAGYLSLFVVYFTFLAQYGHTPGLVSYISMDNAAFRYLMVPFLTLVWYVIGFKVRIDFGRFSRTLAIVSLLVALVFPSNVIYRNAFRIYSFQLKEELRKSVPANAVLFGAYKYDKFFGFDETPSYGFLAHQRYRLYSKCFQNEKYQRILGTVPSLVKSISGKGYVPIIIYPDVLIPDTFDVTNPYQDLKYEGIAAIDMEKKMGPLGWLLPKDKRRIYVARVLMNPDLE